MPDCACASSSASDVNRLVVVWSTDTRALLDETPSQRAHPVPGRNDNRAGERGEEATTRKPWGLRGTSVTSVMCWTSERPRSFRRSCRSTSARRSPSGRTMCSERPASTCPPRPSATTWRCSKSEGYLQQPHTSAGRVPTDKGYRFFVDSIARPGPLDSRPRAAGAVVLRTRARRARADALRHQPAADPPDRPRRRGGGRPARAGDDPQRAARRAVVTGRAGRHRALERRCRAPDHRARRRARGRPDCCRVVPPRASDGRHDRERSCGDPAHR